MSHIKIANESHWHELRKKHVGASESAALFGMLPWKTQWNLWMEKSGKLEAPSLEAVKHVSAGKHFEPAIAAWAISKFGIQLQKVHRYIMADDCPGMGASLDFQQIGTGEYIDTEIKWVVRKDDAWEYEGDEIVKAPDYYIIQAQHQLGCSGNAKAQLLAFIDGDVRRAVYDRREGMIDAIKGRIREFWQSIEADAEPLIDFKADAEAVMRYASKIGHHQIDWSPEVEALAKVAYDMAQRKKESKKAAAAAEAELTMLMIREATAKGMNDPDAQVKVEGGGYRITSTHVDAFPGKEITQEMVGEHIYGRGAYRKMTVSRPKPKAPSQRKPRGEPVLEDSVMARGEGAQSTGNIELVKNEE